MNLSVTFDHDVDPLDAIRMSLDIEGLYPHGIEFRKNSRELEGGMALEAILGDVPGTYPEFDQKVASICAKYGIDADRIKTEVHPHPDGWE